MVWCRYETNRETRGVTYLAVVGKFVRRARGVVRGTFLVRLGGWSIARRERRESPDLSARPITGSPGDPSSFSELRLDV